jgi:hypothetical protein
MGKLPVIDMMIHQMLSTLVLTSWCRWVSLNHRDRLKYPLIRRNGKLERASWDEAMSLIVDKTQEIRARLTNHGVGFYTSGQLFLEDYYVLAMVGKAGLNTLHMCDIRDKRGFSCSIVKEADSQTGTAILVCVPQRLRPACGNPSVVMASLDHTATSTTRIASLW